MRLAEFVLDNREPILAEWEASARTCVPAGIPMDIAALRDHAGEMLTVIAADLAAVGSGAPRGLLGGPQPPGHGGGTTLALRRADPADRAGEEVGHELLPGRGLRHRHRAALVQQPQPPGGQGQTAFDRAINRL